MTQSTISTKKSLTIDSQVNTNNFVYTVTAFTAPDASQSNTAPTFNIYDDLDSSHGNYRVTIQNDGKILVSGLGANPFVVGSNTYGYSILNRYNTDGSLDISYVNSGLFIPDTVGESYYRNPYNVYAWPLSARNTQAVQTDGKTLLASTAFSGGYFSGYSDFRLTRYTVNGTLDTSFNNTGTASADFGDYDFSRAVAIQSDGKIIQVGDYGNSQYTYVGGGMGFGYGYGLNIALVRYNTDGSLDTSFDKDGKVNTTLGYNAHCNGVALQADGKILVTGSVNNAFFLIRYNSNGSLDTSFSGDGIANDSVGINSGFGLAIGADGKILVVGSTNNGFGLVRYNTDGSLDASLPTSYLDSKPIYVEGSAAVALDSAVQIYDAELARTGDYANSFITLMRLGGANSDDVFSALGHLTFSHGNAVLSGVIIGSVDNLDGSLTIHFNSDATQERINEALSSLAYSNYSNAPSSLINIVWVFNDGNTGLQGANGEKSVAGNIIVSLVNQTLKGTASSDTLMGGVGHDILIGLGSVDKLDGKEGSDLYIINTSAEHKAAEMTDTGTTGIDEVRFTATKPSTLIFYAGDTGIEKVTIGTGMAAVAVTTATTPININAAALTNGVTIVGNAGNNRLVGSSGNDILKGGVGNDTLTGGKGKDLFVFNTHFNDKNNVDLITDFTSGKDHLQLSKAVFAGLNTTAGMSHGAILKDVEFVSSPTATHGTTSNSHLIYNSTSGVLYYDADGSGGGAAVEVAILGTAIHPALVAADILVIASAS